MKFEQVAELVETIAPSSLQESWDNCGPQVVCENRDIKRILVCLEVNSQVLEEAVARGADMIITHHPLIFGGINSVDCRTMEGRYIIELIEQGISVFSTHTPFDKIQGGNNDCLAELLDLNAVSGFQTDSGFDMLGRVGMLSSPITMEAFTKLVKEKLIILEGQLSIVGNLSDLVQKVGICAGSGGDMLELALANQCDVMLTGDVKYHQGQKAEQTGIGIVDAGHYGTEKFFTANFAEKLKIQIGSEIEVLQSNITLDPFKLV